MLHHTTDDQNKSARIVFQHAGWRLSAQGGGLYFALNIVRSLKRAVTGAIGRRRCNVCGWRGWEFGSDSWHPHIICPKCSSQVRHRLMVACFQSLEEWSFEKLFRNKRVLHFAPEPADSIGQLIRPLAARYQSADFLDRRHDLHIDMCRMDCLADRALEAVIACDVLEHVPDDRQAMREIYRVLSPGGVAVLAVPQADSLKVKIELPPDASPAERLAKAAQEDHQRIYGEDFPVLLAEVGFRVRVVDQNAFSRRRIRQNGLFPPVLSAHPLATNYRRIFFAQKPTE